MMNRYCIYFVDDERSMQELIKLVLSEDFDVEVFGSAEDCLARLNEKKPDIFLLDIFLPGMDGHTLCRKIKADPATQNVPVFFISSSDTLETRLEGYDAGADDFILKPFHVSDLSQKFKFVQKTLDETARLNTQAMESSQMTSFLFSNIGESANLIQFLRELASTTQTEKVAEAMLRLLETYRLEGVVQIRVGGSEFTQSALGRDRPLEVSIMNNVRTMERIFEFKKRAAYNFEHISVMVNNMPIDDPDLSGRIRDNLAIAVEGSDEKLKAISVADTLNAIQVAETNRRNQKGINEVLENIHTIIRTLNNNQQQDRYQGAEIIRVLQEDLAESFAHLGMTDAQERYIADIVRSRMEQLINLFDRVDQTQQLLGTLSGSLKKLVDY